MLWLLTACLQPNMTDDSVRCDPGPLSPGELRARVRECADEAIPFGEGRRGEWLIENSTLRVAVRAAPNALTHFNTAGGGIVDLATPIGNDLIHEILPTIGSEPLKQAQLELTSNADEAVVSLNDIESGATVKYRIEIDNPTIEFDGHDGLIIVPNEGFERMGQMLIHPEYAEVIAFDGQVTDLGGYLSISGQRIAVDSANQVWKWLNSSDNVHSFSSNGDYFKVFSTNGEELGRFDFDGGEFRGHLPNEAESIQVVKNGCMPSDQLPISMTEIPDLTDCTESLIRVQDEQGHSIFATLNHKDGQIVIPPSGWSLETPMPLEDVVISAGPRHSVATMNVLVPQANTQFDITLYQSTESYLVFSPLANCGPSSELRISAEQSAQALAAQGIDFAICSAEHMVPSFPNLSVHTSAEINLWPGSHSEEPHVLAWPWTQSLRDPGYGAIPPDMSTYDQLDFAAKTGRNTLIDVDWINEHPPPWDTPPDFLLLHHEEELETYRQLLHDRVPIIPLGPINHCLTLSDVQTHPVDIERSLRRMNTSIGNGPVVRLDVDGAHNGELLDEREQYMVSIEIEAPRWMALEELELWSNDALLMVWEMGDSRKYQIPIRGKHSTLSAVVKGFSTLDNSELWGMSSPVFISNVTAPIQDTASGEND